MKITGPLFSFYGSKFRAAPAYPPPRHGTIVEPFAGSAGYSLRYPDRRVILNDADPIIYGVWSYLIRVRESELAALPYDPVSVDDVKGPQEAKWLVGFWLNCGTETPHLSASKWYRSGRDGESSCTQWWKTRDRIIAALPLIRHWRITNRNYQCCDTPPDSTFFIDPPYSGAAGGRYKCQPAGFNALGRWCRGLGGQVIVCEQFGADWLPFTHLGSFGSSPGRHKGFRKTIEVVWTNS